MKRFVVAIVAAICLLLAGCSTTGDGDAASGASSPSVTSLPSSAAPNSEAALRSTLDEFYRVVAQQKQWSRGWDFITPRCQNEVDRDQFAIALDSEYGDSSGRDFSGQPTYLINVNGDTAQVVQKSFDGKGSMKPQSWTFVNGKWLLDYC